MDLSENQRRTLRAFLRAVTLLEPLRSELAATHGISLGDLYAVRVLARLGEVPVSRYGAELGLPRSTITNLVDRLERAGLVARVASPSDRRVTLVRLTESGLDAVEARTRISDSDVARGIIALDDTDQIVLAELLERIVAVEPERDAARSSDPPDGSELAAIAAREPDVSR
jgi:DNA-binding MarR family transcriptional regulator